MGRDFEGAFVQRGLAARPNMPSCLVVSFEPGSGGRLA